MRIIKFLPLFAFLILIGSCIDSNSNRFTKSPIDELIRDMDSISSFVIILYDMDYDESADLYKHQYQLLIDIPRGATDTTDTTDTIEQKRTDWNDVSPELFKKHMEDMGMEVASKKDGVVNKSVSPAGYSNYVGNEKYGHWQQRNGGSFWEFYGKYMFLSSMFRMSMYPVNHGYYNNYRRNYYNTGKSYYGNNGQKTYGTSSTYNKSNSNTRWNKKSSAFKQKVNSRVVRSTQNRINSKNNSRYNQSKSRSRSGGFGK